MSAGRTHLEQLCDLKISSSVADTAIRRTGVICTLGPSCDTVEKLETMIKKGMSIARFNFSHGSHEEHAKLMATLRQAESNLGEQYNVAVALDTKGPEIRTGVLANGKRKVEIKKGDSITVTVDEKEKDNCSEKLLFIDYKNLPKVVSEGSHIFIDDGLISLLVKKIDGDKVSCEVENGGMIGSKKGVNLPGTKVDLPDVTEKDKSDLVFGVQQNVDIVFASFARSGKGMQEIRKAMGEGGEKIVLIAKIESQQGVDNADEILENCDGIMVARGDLGIEIPAQKVFLAQKKLITKCNLAGKPCICATQMLDSMIQKPRPTRAEANDVANAVLDGADCVMLSGETAGGLYPIEALTMMDAVCKEAETAIFYTAYFVEILSLTTRPTNEPDTIAIAATSAAHHLNAQAIICVTSTGNTARLLSRYRPPVMILAITRDARVARQLKLLRGVAPLHYKEPRAANWETDLDNRIKYCTDIGKKKCIFKQGDIAIVVSGPTAGDWPGTGHTNTIRIMSVP